MEMPALSVVIQQAMTITKMNFFGYLVNGLSSLIHSGIRSFTHTVSIPV
jgi:hypothetical protein